MPRKEVDYTNPPINEVVFGAIFNRLDEFRIAHFGSFRSKIFDSYPSTQDQAAVLAQSDAFDFERPLLRTWFLSSDGCKLIQLQQNRFHFNWRRTEDTSTEYPEYLSMYPEFEKRFQEFEGFVKDEQIIEKLVVSELELSYINIIREEDIVPVLGRLGDVFVDHRRIASSTRFLPEVDNFSWTSVYNLPDEIGTLTVDAKTAYRIGKEDSKVAQLSITVRGRLLKNGEGAMQDWFDRAHNQIVKGFSDSTAPEIQEKVWKRK